jgi:hypothetical protein
VAYQPANVRGVAEAADNIESASAGGKTIAAFPSNSLTTSSAARAGGIAMTMKIKLAMVVLGLMAPAAALAAPLDTSDAAYCQALADRYVRYVGHDAASSRLLRDQGTIDGQVAVSQCRSGNASAAIPVLERELSNAKVSLPPRG